MMDDTDVKYTEKHCNQMKFFSLFFAHRIPHHLPPSLPSNPMLNADLSESVIRFSVTFLSLPSIVRHTMRLYYFPPAYFRLSAIWCEPNTTFTIHKTRLRERERDGMHRLKANRFLWLLTWNRFSLLRAFAKILVGSTEFASAIAIFIVRKTTWKQRET